MEHIEGGWRWLSGTPAIPALYAAIEGPKLVREAGIAAIRDQSRRMTARLVELADQRGWPVRAPRDPDRRAGTVAIDVPDGQVVCRALAARNILTDYRPGAGVRIAPHFYNTDEEIDIVIAAMDEVLATAAAG
jgi:kynureninase